MSNSFIKKSAYTLLDWITLGKGVVRQVNGMKIRFPARWSRYYESNYEEDNYILLQKQVKPGMQVIDIGAHLGLFSVACSKLTGPGGKVVSFEPTPKTFSVLKIFVLLLLLRKLESKIIRPCQCRQTSWVVEFSFFNFYDILLTGFNKSN